ncbi:hypothetical protein, partial [Streptomyces sp. NPDC101115]|uniref:hypothetical protein n=1 Tax=Streptomyces sp. NPDC101115 TaxID=3366106 RepID=UPI00381348C5
MNEGATGPGRLATFVGAVAAPTGLVTGLLYYFGYFHAYWFFAYFRVNSTVLGFSTADYLMRSLDALWVPLTVAATLGVAVFWGYDLGRRRLGPVMGPLGGGRPPPPRPPRPARRRARGRGGPRHVAVHPRGRPPAPHP